MKRRSPDLGPGPIAGLATGTGTSIGLSLRKLGPMGEGFFFLSLSRFIRAWSRRDMDLISTVEDDLRGSGEVPDQVAEELAVFRENTDIPRKTKLIHLSSIPVIQGRIFRIFPCVAGSSVEAMACCEPNCRH